MMIRCTHGGQRPNQDEGDILLKLQDQISANA